MTVDGRHGAQLHHRFDDLRTFHRHLVSQFANGDGFADYDVTVNGLRWLLEALLQSGTFTVLTAFIPPRARPRGLLHDQLSIQRVCCLSSPDEPLCCYGYGRDRLRLHDRYHLQPDEHAVMW